MRESQTSLLPLQEQPEAFLVHNEGQSQSPGCDSGEEAKALRAGALHLLEARSCFLLRGEQVLCFPSRPALPVGQLGSRAKARGPGPTSRGVRPGCGPGHLTKAQGSGPTLSVGHTSGTASPSYLGSEPEAVHHPRD